VVVCAEREDRVEGGEQRENSKRGESDRRIDEAVSVEGGGAEVGGYEKFEHVCI
jgi:hypothetical protein